MVSVSTSQDMPYMGLAWAFVKVECVHIAGVNRICSNPRIMHGLLMWVGVQTRLNAVDELLLCACVLESQQPPLPSCRPSIARDVFGLIYFPRALVQDCTLILTEGDSAKALAVSGLGVVGRDRYGVFPLKGKLLNVREATNPQVLKNEEIQVGCGAKVEASLRGPCRAISNPYC